MCVFNPSSCRLYGYIIPKVSPSVHVCAGIQIERYLAEGLHVSGSTEEHGHLPT